MGISWKPFRFAGCRLSSGFSFASVLIHTGLNVVLKPVQEKNTIQVWRDGPKHLKESLDFFKMNSWTLSPWLGLEGCHHSDANIQYQVVKQEAAANARLADCSLPTTATTRISAWYHWIFFFPWKNSVSFTNWRTVMNCLEHITIFFHKPDY